MVIESARPSPPSTVHTVHISLAVRYTSVPDCTLYLRVPGNILGT